MTHTDHNPRFGKKIKSTDLRLTSLLLDKKPLGVGQKVQLLGGGAVCLVVDILPDNFVVIAWSGKAESTVHRACLRRII